MSSDRTDASVAPPEDLTVRFPELPVVSYLRLMAWSDRASEAIVNDAAFDSVARANGVHVLDRSLVRLSHRCRATFCDEAARAVRAGRATMAPVVSAPRRLWRESLSTYERANEWFERLRATDSPIPSPTREVETTQRRLADALRSAYSAG
jgi:hypothetical protein